MARKLDAPLPRIALTPAEAAASIGVGPDFFLEHVLPELHAVIYRGRKRLIPVAELERWSQRVAVRPATAEDPE